MCIFKTQRWQKPCYVLATVILFEVVGVFWLLTFSFFFKTNEGKVKRGFAMALPLLLLNNAARCSIAKLGSIRRKENVV